MFNGLPAYSGLIRELRLFLLRLGEVFNEFWPKHLYLDTIRLLQDRAYRIIRIFDVLKLVNIFKTKLF